MDESNSEIIRIHIAITPYSYVEWVVNIHNVLGDREK